MLAFAHVLLYYHYVGSEKTDAEVSVWTRRGALDKGQVVLLEVRAEVMKWFDSTKRRHVTPTSQLRYFSVYASPVGRYGKTHVMHVAGSMNYTLCGRELSDPYTVSPDGYEMCAQCAKRRADQ